MGATLTFPSRLKDLTWAHLIIDGLTNDVATICAAQQLVSELRER